MADRAASGVLTQPEQVRDVIRAFSDIGIDEMLFLPQVHDPEQVDRLADIVG